VDKFYSPPMVESLNVSLKPLLMNSASKWTAGSFDPVVA
jgi:hypothetical protein